MKKVLPICLILLSNMAYSQSNCSLINQVTLSADTNTVFNQTVSMGYGGGTQATIDTINWNYIVFTKAANLASQVFVNGQKVNGGAFGNNAYSYTQLYIAAGFFTSFTGFFNGWLDELRVSNIVRDSTSIATHYTSGTPFVVDANTVGLWHFDETSGTSFANSVSGSGTLFNGANFTTGNFGNAVFFDGIDDRGDCNINIPEDNITIEFWVKVDNGIQTAKTLVQPYGMYNSTIALNVYYDSPEYQWSTGDTTATITIDPSIDTLVWVTDGSCTDTVTFFQNDSTAYDTTFVTVNDTTVVYDTTFVTVTDTVVVNDTTFVTVTDTVVVNDTSYITVTDTLIIDVMLGLSPPNDVNTILVYPNPASTNLIISNGNYLNMSGYSIEIRNIASQSMFQSLIAQQQFDIDISQWNAGLYFIDIIDTAQQIIDTRKLVIQ